MSGKLIPTTAYCRVSTNQDMQDGSFNESYVLVLLATCETIPALLLFLFLSVEHFRGRDLELTTAYRQILTLFANVLNPCWHCNMVGHLYKSP